MKSSTRAGLTLTVLMIALFILVAAVANIGPVELMAWIAVLVGGWVVILYGARRSDRT